MKNHSIKQAVIPAAGLGTRFLPVTKILPKELLPIMAKPALQYIVEELVQSGIEEIILVLSPEKETVFHYFSDGGFIDQILDERGHQDKLLELRTLLKKVTFKRVYQHNPLGLGHAVSCAKKEICTDYFAVVLPDDIVFSQTPCMLQMVQAFEQNATLTLGVETVAANQISSYGVVSPTQDIKKGSSFLISGVVEKPSPKDAPSDQAVIGRYILPREIFNLIPEQAQSFHQEIQLTDAIDQWIKKDSGQALSIVGRRIDVGQPIGFVKANLLEARLSDDHSQEIKEFIRDLVE